jgi:ribosome-associated heat shock protein Hsp15
MATRVDSWIWSIRLTKTRSAAGAACRAGHVRVNGATAKPAQVITVGDEVRVRVGGRERIVEVVREVAKRVSATVAAACYIDKSPPPPSKEVLTSQPRRDRGAGRPTKRERRELDRFRAPTMVALLAALMLVVVGCGGGSKGGGGDDGPPKAPGDAGTGPYFGECGNVTTEEVVKITGFGGLQNTVNNTSSCEWSSNNLRTGAVVSFNWYRGSPIDRERATEQLSRAVTENVEIKGHKGFIAWDETICEIGIAFGADFFEWSVRADYTSQMPTQQICAATRQLSTMSIERSSS